MAYEQSLRYVTLRAPSTALSGYQYQMVIASSSEGYFKAGSTKAAGVLNIAIGVLQDAPTVAGEACKLGYGGITKLKTASSTLTPGSRFIMGALGKAQSTGSAVAQDIIYGPWLSAAGTTDSIGTAMLQVIGITT